MFPRNSYVKALTPNVTVFWWQGGQGFGKLLVLDEVLRVGLWSDKISALIRRVVRELAVSLSPHTQRKGQARA